MKMLNMKSENKPKQYKYKFRLIFVLAVLTITMMMVGFDSSQPKIYDQADLLSESEEKRLQTLAVENAVKTNIDFVIVTTNENNGKSAKVYAEDFFMEHEFGYDSVHGNAILLLIDMESRDVWISTSGDGIKYMSNILIDRVVSAVTTALGKGEYYDACKTFITKSAGYITASRTYQENGGQNGSHNGEASAPVEAEKDNRTGIILVSALIGLAAAAGVIAFLVYKTKASGQSAGPRTYNNRFTIRNQSDIYVNTTVVKHKIEKDSNNNSGLHGSGSSHTGSGGHTFGGGGGKF